MPGASVIPATVAHSLSEKDFQAQVLELASLYGWTSYHTFDSRRSAPGFPDLILLRPPRLLALELKAETGSVTDSQRRWLQLFEQCGGVALVLRPSDWPKIEEMLKR